MTSNLTSLQPLGPAMVLITYELDDDGDVQPMFANINGDDVDVDLFGVELTEQWARGIEAERQNEADYVMETRAEERAWRFAA